MANSRTIGVEGQAESFTQPVHALEDHTGLPGVGAGGGSGIDPAGIIVPFGGDFASVPSGYLACDGSVVAQATYPDLFAAIDTSWDIGGEGGGNFRLPDLRGRSLVGLNNADTIINGSFSTRELADIGGEESHSLIESELPSHSHPLQNFSADFSANSTGPVGGGSNVMTAAASTEGRNLSLSNINNPTSTTGGGGAHNTMQPFAVVTYIIKTENTTSGGGGGGGGTPRQEVILLEATELPIDITGGDVALTNKLSFTPLTDSVQIFVNRLFHLQGATFDYQLAGIDDKEILWLVDSGTAPQLDSSDTVVAVYLSSD